MKLISNFFSKSSQLCPEHSQRATQVCTSPSCTHRLICRDDNCQNRHLNHAKYVKEWEQYSDSLALAKGILGLRRQVAETIGILRRKILCYVEEQMQQMGNKLQKEIDKKYSSPRLLELERRCNAKQDYTPFLFELGNNYPQIYPALLAKIKETEQKIPKMVQLPDMLSCLQELAVGDVKSVVTRTQSENLAAIMPFKCELRLKFQASKNKFLTANMHAVDIRGPILLVVQSHKGKTFGGYSSIMFPKNDDEEDFERRHSHSFLFSLDHSQLLHLKEDRRQYTLKGGKNFGFGRGDLLISDECNKGNISWAQIGRDYQAPSNVSGPTNEWLGGAAYFRVLEYEIYEVEYLDKK